MHILIKKKYLYFHKYKVKCAVGKRGIGHKKKEGDLITPIGIFKIKFILFRKDRIRSFKTSVKKISLNKKLGWCDDPKSKKYNKLIKHPFKNSYEKLYRKDNIYDLILVLNYNMNPIKKNKGSAIFIHVAKRNFNRTEGCIAIKKNELLKIIKDLKKETKVKIV
jgi:L,D-peptidoglycan transpeptidase YkuD (ErfK/YbiS/YcfS/YnhG family)